MKISASQAATSQGGYIPEGLYRARCLGTKYTDKNGSGQPMTTLKCEIIEPETTVVNGRQVTVAGRKFDLFLIHNVEKTGWASHEQCLEFCEKVGIELGKDEAGEPEYDTSLHKEYFQGLEFDIPLKAEESIKTYASNVGDHKKGDPILDGDGNKISNGFQVRANPSDVPKNCHPSKNETIANQPY